jgi:pimeloyl-ACP methyl ester carboxylesterase
MLFTTINGHKTAYRISSVAGHGCPSLLCVHGSGGDSSVWASQLSGLAADCSLIAPDLPGHGKTQGRGGYTIEEYAGWLESFAEALGLESFILMGYSMGGAVAQAMAHAYPTRVAGLVLVSTAMRFIVAPEYLQVLQTDFPRAARASCDNAYAPGVSPGLYHRGLEMLLGNGGQAMYEDVFACTQFDSTAWAAKISAPGLVISGSNDTITPPESGEALAAALPQAKFKSLPAAGHMVMQEAADKFNAAVRQFIAR